MRDAPGQVRAPRRAPRLRQVAVGLGGVLALVATLLVGPGSPAQAAANETVNAGVIATISYAPNSYVIGNAYENWTDVIQGPAQFDSGPGNPSGAYYRWGFLVGPNFSACAWIEDGQTTSGASVNNRCATPQQHDTALFTATYTNGQISPSAGDGDTATQTGAADCAQGFGNVEPWRVPATPGNARGLNVTDTLLWRYVTKDGNYVMVHDTVATAGAPNWFFVPRDCVSF